MNRLQGVIQTQKGAQGVPADAEIRRAKRLPTVRESAPTPGEESEPLEWGDRLLASPLFWVGLGLGAVEAGVDAANRAEHQVQEINLERIDDLTGSIRGALGRDTVLDAAGAQAVAEQLFELTGRVDYAKAWLAKSASQLNDRFESDYELELLTQADKQLGRADDLRDTMSSLLRAAAVGVFDAAEFNTRRIAALSSLIEGVPVDGQRVSRGWESPAEAIKGASDEVFAQFRRAQVGSKLGWALKLTKECLRKSVREALDACFQAELRESGAFERGSGSFRGDGHHYVGPKRETVAALGAAEVALRQAQSAEALQVSYAAYAASATPIERALSISITEEKRPSTANARTRAELQKRSREYEQRAVLSIYGTVGEGRKALLALQALTEAIGRGSKSEIPELFGSFLRRAERVDAGLCDRSPRKAALLQHVRSVRAQAEITLEWHVLPTPGTRITQLSGLARDDRNEAGRAYFTRPIRL